MRERKKRDDEPIREENGGKQIKTKRKRDGEG
jgi:hypothetical protein